MPRSSLCAAIAAAGCLAFAAPSAADEEAQASKAEEAKAGTDAAKRENVERMGKELRRMATSPRAAEKKDEIRKHVEALASLGGAPAAKAALEALAFDDPDVEKDVILFVETVRDRTLVAPLREYVEHKDHRRRFRLHALIAHALGAIADVEGMETLTELVGSEDNLVVAAAATAFLGFKTAPHAKRVEPVKRMLERYESTYNLKESAKPEQRVEQSRAEKAWDIYGKQLRAALQALTGQPNLSSPRDFRVWWNDNKKATNW